MSAASNATAMTVYRKLTGNRMNYFGHVYGVEVEVEGVPAQEHARQQSEMSFVTPTLYEIQQQWRATSDGSLRNRGMEWISAPDSVENTLARVRLLYTGMDQGLFSPSVRTGIHIHANVQNLMGPEIVALMRRYAVLEPLLFNYVGQEREQNIYCVPLYRAANEQRLWRELAAALQMPEIPRLQAAQMFDRCCKYSALNLQPMRRQGSVEYRHAPTFRHRREMDGWMRLVDYVHSTTAFPDTTWTEATLRDIWEMGAMPCSADTFSLLMVQVVDRGLLSFANSLLPFTYKAAEWGSPAGLAFPSANSQARRPRGMSEIMMQENLDAVMFGDEQPPALEPEGEVGPEPAEILVPPPQPRRTLNDELVRMVQEQRVRQQNRRRVVAEPPAVRINNWDAAPAEVATLAYLESEVQHGEPGIVRRVR